MGRSPCCDANGLKRGPWTPEEDQKLLAYVKKHGHGNWRSLPDKAGLQRCGKSCRLRWINYLRPDIKRGKFSLNEQKTIIQLHALLGNRWSAIASHLPKRTDNEIKNYWNTHIKKKLGMMGIDPATHKPVARVTSLGSGTGMDDPKKVVSNLTHMAQWESARLEAEARLVKQSSKQHKPQPSPRPNKVASRAEGRPCCLDILKAWQRVQFKSIINVSYNCDSNKEGSMACQDVEFDQAWGNSRGDGEVQLIKGLSNLLCESDDLVQCLNGNSGSSNDGVGDQDCEENYNYYWEDVFNLVDDNV